MIAVIDSSAKKVLILSLVLWRRVWYGMIVAFGFSKNMLQLIFMRSITASPVSFSAVIMALSLWLFGCLSKTLSMCCFVARLTPSESPFG